jgi:hypothetical protein
MPRNTDGILRLRPTYMQVDERVISRLVVWSPTVSISSICVSVSWSSGAVGGDSPDRLQPIVLGIEVSQVCFEGQMVGDGDT